MYFSTKKIFYTFCFLSCVSLLGLFGCEETRCKAIECSSDDECVEEKCPAKSCQCIEQTCKASPSTCFRHEDCPWMHCKKGLCLNYRCLGDNDCDLDQTCDVVLGQCKYNACTTNTCTSPNVCCDYGDGTGQRCNLPVCLQHSDCQQNSINTCVQPLRCEEGTSPLCVQGQCRCLVVCPEKERESNP